MATAVIFNTTAPLSDIPTPLVFFTPHQAFSVNLAVYIHIGSTTVLIWDILNNLGNDFKLLRTWKTWKTGLPTALYFTTRFTLLAYALGKAVLMTAPVENCAKFETALNGILIVLVCCTTLLFYIRVSALYSFNKYIVAFFGATWLATFAMSITFLDTFVAENIGPTQYCIEKIRGRFLGASSIVLLFNEILTYLAVTYRVYCIFHDSDASLRQRMNLVVFGTSLPVLSKVILQDSQLYCLAIVLSKAFLVVINSTVRDFDPPASIMFIISHLVLVNILACRVHRNLKIGHRNTTEASFYNDHIVNMEFAAPTKNSHDETSSRTTFTSQHREEISHIHSFSSSSSHQENIEVPEKVPPLYPVRRTQS